MNKQCSNSCVATILFASVRNERKETRNASYQLLKTFLPGVWLLVLFRIYLVELPCLGVHHGSRVLENLHVQPLPEKTEAEQ